MLIKDTFVQWLDDNPLQLAAALAYYTLFSIAPLLLDRDRSRWLSVWAGRFPTSDYRCD
jgi:hypothetical protein